MSDLKHVTIGRIGVQNSTKHQSIIEMLETAGYPYVDDDDTDCIQILSKSVSSKTKGDHQHEHDEIGEGETKYLSSRMFEVLDLILSSEAMTKLYMEMTTDKEIDNRGKINAIDLASYAKEILKKYIMNLLGETLAEHNNIKCLAVSLMANEAGNAVVRRYVDSAEFGVSYKDKDCDIAEFMGDWVQMTAFLMWACKRISLRDDDCAMAYMDRCANNNDTRKFDVAQNVMSQDKEESGMNITIKDNTEKKLMYAPDGGTSTVNYPTNVLEDMPEDNKNTSNYTDKDITKKNK